MANKPIKKSTIFTVTVIYLDLNAIGYSKLRRTRIWGYFKDFKTAEKCVKQNWTDIYENGYYNFALINEVPEGVCVSPKKQTWYSVKYINSSKYKISKLRYDPLNKNSSFKVRICW